MAGSLNHIIDDETGGFTMSTIENMGDAHEALEECFDIIAVLLESSPNPATRLRDACLRAKAPVPAHLPMFGARS
jgi:hypothetical protein